MALTPEDVVNKRFETTRFRDGYDQDEVDDFLDEVVKELRRLVEENETLRARVAELESGAPSTATTAGTTSTDAPAPIASSETGTSSQDTADLSQSATDDSGDPHTAAEHFAEEQTETAASAAQATASPSSGADSLLALAQRVHDEHVAEGEQQRAALIAEGERQAQQIEQDAEVRKTQLDDEFQTKTKDLEAKKVELESKIDELKTFERDYRLKLRGYIESQLRDLDRSSSLAFGGSSSTPTDQQ